MSGGRHPWMDSCGRECLSSALQALRSPSLTVLLHLELILSVFSIKFPLEKDFAIKNLKTAALLRTDMTFSYECFLTFYEDQKTMVTIKIVTFSGLFLNRN
jgi:hypothetical protein